MPTKNERIAALEREVENLKEQLRFCEMAAEGKPEHQKATFAEKQPQFEVKTSETASRETQPAASSSESSETKQS